MLAKGGVIVLVAPINASLAIDVGVRACVVSRIVFVYLSVGLPPTELGRHYGLCLCYRSRCAYVLCIFILSAFRFKMEVAFVPRKDYVKCLICNQWLRCEQVFDHLRGSKHHNNRFHARAREAARIAETFSLDAMD